MIVTSNILLLMICLLSLISFVVLDHKIISLLESNSPDVYRAIGKPSVWVHMPTKYSYWFKFLLFGKFKTFDLPATTSKLCIINRCLILTIILLAIAWVYSTK